MIIPFLTPRLSSYWIDLVTRDDVPLLTDQFAPVENLLNPITSTPYNIEHKQTAMNTKVDPSSPEGTSLPSCYLR
jgi:hypothetical protein